MTDRDWLLFRVALGLTIFVYLLTFAVLVIGGL
jgi:hypothetical protein